jgi:transposase
MEALELKHPEQARRRLLALAEEIPGAWIGLKIAALLLVVEGQRPVWIADVLGLSRMSLTRWIHGVNRSGVETLKEPIRTGPTPRMNPAQQQVLAQNLQKSPLDFGLRRLQWDGPTLVQHIQKQFGVKLTVRQAQKWLHKLGYRMKRASHVYVQARAEDARRFQRHIKKAQTPG